MDPFRFMTKFCCKGSIKVFVSKTVEVNMSNISISVFMIDNALNSE